MRIAAEFDLGKNPPSCFTRLVHVDLSADRLTPGSAVDSVLRDESSPAAAAEPEPKSRQFVIEEDLIGSAV
jgi:hypothetical protein